MIFQFGICFKFQCLYKKQYLKSVFSCSYLCLLLKLVICSYLQARTHQLLLQNRDLLDHMNQLIGCLQKLEVRATRVHDKIPHPMISQVRQYMYYMLGNQYHLVRTAMQLKHQYKYQKRYKCRQWYVYTIDNYYSEVKSGHRNVCLRNNTRL